jgi:hypothetical protein
MATTRLRSMAGGLAVVDVVFLAALLARRPVVRPMVGPESDDLATWTAGVVGTYTVAQAAIALRPTPEGARLLAVLRAVLIGGDLAIAWRGRHVGRLGVPTAVGNAALAALAWASARGAGTTAETPAPNLPAVRRNDVQWALAGT